MSILKIRNASGNFVGIATIKGDKGDDGDVSDVKVDGISVVDSNGCANIDLTSIEEKIPSQASSSNQLADKNFVNSTVGTNTANYISNNGQPFTSLADLQAYSGTVTHNDYAFITGTDTEGNIFYDRYKATVNGSTVTWGKEYRLNNSSFTAVQWAAISSGITASLVTKLEGLHNITSETITGVDLDTKKDVIAFYYCQACTNTPVASSGYLVVQKVTDNYVKQEYTSTDNLKYMRTCNNGTWNSWKRIYKEGDMLIYDTYGESNVDANDYVQSGFYYLGTGCSNLPLNLGYVKLIVDGATGSGDIIQIAISVMSTPRIFVRSKVNNIWNSWQSVAHGFNYALTSGDDFNSLTEQGTYQYGGQSGILNPPPNFGIIDVKVANTYISQTCIHSGVMHQRISYDSGANWSNWAQI